jgi:RHS repeat-associated protein
MHLGNELLEHNTYDPQTLQPTQIALGSSITDASKLQLDYTYNTSGMHDNNGNVRTQTLTFAGLSQPLIQKYSYDQLNRLQSAEESNGGVRQWIQSFGYDRYGNRRMDRGVDDHNQPKTTSDLLGPDPQISQTSNRIVRRDNSTEQYDYDATGNLVKDQVGNTYAYDGENLQSTYTAAGSTGAAATYYYDGGGQRVKKIVGSEVTIFVYNIDGMLIAEYGNGAVTPNGTQYLTTDLLGSPRVVTDSHGIAQERHDYLPFGEEIAQYYNAITPRSNIGSYRSDFQRKKYAGYERDRETNLDYAQARYYHNLSGRFTSVDPSLGSARLTDPQSWNRYLYCGNNPLKQTDPNGTDPRWWASLPTSNDRFMHVQWSEDPGAGFTEASLIHQIEDPNAKNYGKWEVLNPFSEESTFRDTLAEARATLWAYTLDHEIGSPPLISEDTLTAFAGITTGADWTGTSHFIFKHFSHIDTESRLYQNTKAMGGAIPIGLSLGALHLASVGEETVLSIGEGALSNCFVAGTPVQTRGGLKAIETIKAGDEVLSWNQSTHQAEYKPVLRTFVNQAAVLVTIAVAGQESPIITTPGHLFYVHRARDNISADEAEADGQWVFACALHAGQEVRRATGEWSHISRVGRRIGPALVYNFEVADNHTFFIGSLSLLVHNQSIATTPSFLGQESGPAVPVPAGASGPTLVDSGKGIRYTGGTGGNGLAPEVNSVRVMDGTASYPNGYVNYGKTMSDGSWQSVHPFTGKPVSKSSPWWHISLD